jgi:hypothetical protein
MFKMLVVAGTLCAALVCEVQAAPVSAEVQTVAWRGGYRYRRNSSAASSRPVSSNRTSGSRSSGRSSALDYPSYSQPYASRTHQWNKYPNQPFYLRGERRSLGILP